MLFGWQPEPFGDDGAMTLWRLPGYVEGETVVRGVELGGNVVVPPQDTLGFRTAALADPQGAVFR